MLEERKQSFAELSNQIGTWLSFLGMKPNFYTILSLCLAAAGLFLIAYTHLVAGLVLFIGAGLMDFVDGAVARATNKITAKGAYLDTISDRYVEMLALLSFLFLDLQSVWLPVSIWVMLALFGGMMTTYAKAAQSEKKLTETEKWRGFAGRPERLILILAVFILALYSAHWAVYPLMLLATVTNLTALQRIILALRQKDV